jgi:hypothetical protein
MFFSIAATPPDFPLLTVPASIAQLPAPEQAHFQVALQKNGAETRNPAC